MKDPEDDLLFAESDIVGLFNRVVGTNFKNVFEIGPYIEAHREEVEAKFDAYDGPKIDPVGWKQ